MKKTLTMFVVAILVGCGSDAEARTNDIPGKTVDQTITEIKSTGRVIIVPNTEHIDYQAYRLEWRRVNDKHAPRWAPDVKLSTKTRKDDSDREIVELHLSDLSFGEAFSIEFRGKGEGHMFWWRGKEYTTNLLDVIRKPAFQQTDPYIERIVPVVKELTPTEVTLPKEEEPTTEEE